MAESIFEILPNEIINLIMSKLTYVDLARTLTVSQQWREIANIQIERMIRFAKNKAFVLNLMPEQIFMYVDEPLVMHYLFQSLDSDQHRAIYRLTNNPMVKRELKDDYQVKCDSSGKLLPSNRPHLPKDLSCEGALQIILNHETVKQSSILKNSNLADGFSYHAYLSAMIAKIQDDTDSYDNIRREIHNLNHVFRCNMLKRYQLQSDELKHGLCNGWLISVRNYPRTINMFMVLCQNFTRFMTESGLQEISQIFSKFAKLYVEYNLLSENQLTPDAVANFDMSSWHTYLGKTARCLGRVSYLAWGLIHRQIELMMIIYALYGSSALHHARFDDYRYYSNRNLVIVSENDTLAKITLADIMTVVKFWQQRPDAIEQKMITSFCKSFLYYFHVTRANIDLVIQNIDLFTHLYVTWDEDLVYILGRLEYIHDNIVLQERINEHTSFTIGGSQLKRLLAYPFGKNCVEQYFGKVDKTVDDMLTVIEAEINIMYFIKNRSDIEVLCTLITEYNLFERVISTQHLCNFGTLSIIPKDVKNEILTYVTPDKYQQMLELCIAQVKENWVWNDGTRPGGGILNNMYNNDYENVGQTIPDFLVTLLSHMQIDVSKNVKYLAPVFRQSPRLFLAEELKYLRQSVIRDFDSFTLIIILSDYPAGISSEIIRWKGLIFDRYLDLTEGKLLHSVKPTLMTQFIMAEWVRTRGHLTDANGEIHPRSKRLVRSLQNNTLSKRDTDIFDRFFGSQHQKVEPVTKNGKCTRKRKRT